jgi:hypothetical protein
MNKKSATKKIPHVNDKLKILINDFFDHEYYLLEYPDVAHSGEDGLGHYLKIGWREGRKPNKWFETSLLPKGLDIENPDIPPFLLYLNNLAAQNPVGVKEFFMSQHKKEVGHKDCWECNVMRNDFDGNFYRRFYPDLKDIKDSLIHFCEIGWKENRNPNSKFVTSYYIESNADVKDAQINPFAHYLKTGINEGRKGSPANPIKHYLLKQIPNFNDSLDTFVTNKLSIGIKNILLEKLFQPNKPLVLSISHDNFLKSVGGIQKFIREECHEAQLRKINYLHLSPITPKLINSNEPYETTLLSVNFNEDELGIYPLSEIVEVLCMIEDRNKKALNTLVVHSTLGWNLEVISNSFFKKFNNNFFYVHDYHFLCREYRLLRNFVESCNAPNTNSTQCKICAHSSGRNNHITEYKKFITSNNFQLIFPSNAALKIFKASKILPKLNFKIYPHIEISTIKNTSKKIEIVKKEKIKIAFCGEPVPHKGFIHFLELSKRLCHLEKIEFYHFGRLKSEHSHLNFIKTTINDNNAQMSKNIKEYGIDCVFMGSYWAETFNYVAYEALEGGAVLMGNQQSGNIADLIKNTGVGVLYDSIEDCIDMISEQETLSKNLSVAKSNLAKIAQIKNLSYIYQGQ